jgi:hypothetical protein
MINLDTPSGRRLSSARLVKETFTLRRLNRKGADDMRPHLTLSQLRNLKPTILAGMLLVAFLGLCAVGFVSSTAQSTRKEERELEDNIPKHLPIKVKVKNLNKEKWTRDVEVEVTNTGDKPIYYLRLSLFFVDVKMDSGNEIGFPLRYGRPQLVDLGNRAIPEDIPIQPGETYVFKTIRGLTIGWEKFRSKHKKPHPKKVGLQFEVINYGDGTGFMTTGGLPVPAPQSSNPPCENQQTGRALGNTVQNFSSSPNPDARPPLTIS